MRILVFFIVFALIGPLSFSSVSLSGPDSTGTISGCVILPNALDTAKAPKEAKLYIYLKDYTPKDGKEVLAWEASIRKIIDFEIRSLKSHRVAFEFTDLPEGIFGVSVLVDTGKPHVLPGSSNLVAFPGDYAGGSKETLKLESNQSREFQIDRGFYMPVPDGYDLPLYSSE